MALIFSYQKHRGEEKQETNFHISWIILSIGMIWNQFILESCMLYSQDQFFKAHEDEDLKTMKAQVSLINLFCYIVAIWMPIQVFLGGKCRKV